MIKRSFIFAALFAVAWGQAARAQERVPCVRLACAASMAERPGTFRINGLGLIAAILAGGLCESQHCAGSTVAGAVFGGGLGFTIGVLVGGQFRKAAASGRDAA